MLVSALKNNKYLTMSQKTKLSSNRTDKTQTVKQLEREQKEKEANKAALSKANPKIDNNVIRGYN
jgi:hypothetical protein